jgi:hypothetical protein
MLREAVRVRRARLAMQVGRPVREILGAARVPRGRRSLTLISQTEGRTEDCAGLRHALDARAWGARFPKVRVC